jgi:hypothetical protein
VGSKIKAMMRLHYMDTMHSFVIFWSILIAVFLLSCYLTYQFSDSRVMFSGWFAVYIYALVGGVVTVNGTLPVALGWSVTRRDYYLATVIHYVLVSFALSVVYALLYGIEKWFLSVNPDVHLLFYQIPWMERPSVWFLLWFHFIVILAIVSCGNVVGCLYYRFGRLGLFASFAIVLLLTVMLHLLDGWKALFRWLSRINSVEELTLWLIPFAFVCLVAGWLFLRKAPARTAG